MSGSTETIENLCPRRRSLKVAVSALCAEAGFVSAEDQALETLTEMMQSYLFELGRSSRAFCELSCRTEPMLSDVVMALVEMGMNVRSIPAYARRTNKTVLPAPAQNSNQSTSRLLQVGQKKKHPSHIPDYLPPFPDPHTYIKSQTHKEPETEYQSIREKAATQKRDVERALTRFIAKTGETESLFPDDPYAFPLIANKSKPLPYIDCLMPKEEDLTSQDGEESKSDQQNDSSQKGERSNTDCSKSTGPPNILSNDSQTIPLKSQSQESNLSSNGTANESMDMDSQIDNPYLREIKMPKLKGAGKKSTSIQAMSSSSKWSF